jgi:hypothetical protein
VQVNFATIPTFALSSGLPFEIKRINGSDAARASAIFLKVNDAACADCMVQGNTTAAAANPR